MDANTISSTKPIAVVITPVSMGLVCLLAIFGSPPYKYFVSENEFPSGPWVGFYAYHAKSDKHRMDLGLTFSDGRISGEGNDDIGRFIIRGHFDAANRECYWTKTYVGSHDVFYRGFREGKGIWGTWEILADARGGFHIWPRAQAEGEGEAVSAAEQFGVPAVAVGVPARRLVIRLVYNQA